MTNQSDNVLTEEQLADKIVKFVDDCEQFKREDMAERMAMCDSAEFENIVKLEE